MYTKKDDYSYFQAVKWLYSRLLSKRKRQFWLLFLAMSFAALLETAAVGSVAFFASSITDPDAVLKSSVVIKWRSHLNLVDDVKDLILFSGIIMFCFIVIKNIMKAVVIYGITRFGVLTEAYFGQRLLEGLLKLPYKWHLGRNSADLVTTMNWRQYLGRLFFQPCLNILNNCLMVSIMLTGLFIVDPSVSLSVVCVLGLASVLIYKVIRKKVDKTAAVARDYELNINKEVSMAFHGIKDVKIAAMENAFSSRFYKKAFSLAKIYGKQELFADAPVLILETIGFGMICLAIFSMLILNEDSTAHVTGTMVVLAVTGWRALPAVNKILNSMTKVRKALPIIKNQIQYFTEIEANNDLPVPLERVQHSFSDSIHFNDVDFFYKNDGPSVIHGLEFRIKKGDSVGIIGKSGAGKSTLVDLLIGLLKPTNGTITIDGKPLDKEVLSIWLNTTGYVPQTPFIYDGTLVENIGFGIENSSIDKTWAEECCQMASMDDFLYEMEKGLDTQIGERGIKLSGGQCQRVAIARALYRRPEILIFDEATSSLDTESEKAIQKTIYSFKGKQTLIVIAHRLSTVAECDYLIWLEKGEIRMQGETQRVLTEYKKSLDFRF